jgi:hypothetical protein
MQCTKDNARLVSRKTTSLSWSAEKMLCRATAAHAATLPLFLYDHRPRLPDVSFDFSSVDKTNLRWNARYVKRLKGETSGHSPT